MRALISLLITAAMLQACEQVSPLSASSIEDWTQQCESNSDVTFIAYGIIETRSLEFFLEPYKVLKSSKIWNERRNIFIQAERYVDFPPNGHPAFICMNDDGLLEFIGTDLG